MLTSGASLAFTAPIDSDGSHSSVCFEPRPATESVIISTATAASTMPRFRRTSRAARLAARSRQLALVTHGRTRGTAAATSRELHRLGTPRARPLRDLAFHPSSMLTIPLSALHFHAHSALTYPRPPTRPCSARPRRPLCWSQLDAACAAAAGGVPQPGEQLKEQLLQLEERSAEEVRASERRKQEELLGCYRELQAGGELRAFASASARCRRRLAEGRRRRRRSSG